MSHGHLTLAQRTALRPFVAGHVVHDLGAGDCELAHHLLDLGASWVIAVDKAYEDPTVARQVLTRKDDRITLSGHRFSSFVKHNRDNGGRIEVAFVSWPQNRPDEGLVALLKGARCIVYLGKNTDGSACGGADFWGTVLPRGVLAYEPDKTNTLIVYGPPRTGMCRFFKGEEIAAASQFKKDSQIMSYEDAERT